MTSIETIFRELEATASQLSEEQRSRVVAELLQAKKVFVAGAGRSGLMAKSFAMRLMHIGLDPFVVGETITPNLEHGDVLVIASGSGETKGLLSMAEKAKSLDATVIAVTIQPDSSIGKLADHVLEIPAQTKDDSGKSVQPMGSLFEQSVLLVFDAIVLDLMNEKGMTGTTMYGRHANLE